MKAAEFNLRGVNKGESVQVENGQNIYTILITNKLSGYGSGKKTVYSGTIKKDGEHTANFENADILVIKRLMGITTTSSSSSSRKAERKLYEALATLRTNMYNELLATLSEDTDRVYTRIADGAEDEESETLTDEQLLLLLARCTQHARRIMWKKEAEAEAEAEAEKARKATAQALLKGGLTAEQLAQIQAILEAK